MYRILGEDDDPSDQALLSTDHTVKRLDFEDIPFVNSDMNIVDKGARVQALQLRRDLERCREDVTDPIELIESLKLTAEEYADVDLTKLWEEYLNLKKEFLRVETENLFLESYLQPPESSQDVIETELHGLEKELCDIRSMSSKETQEIGSLISTFATAMENFPRLAESTLKHFDECDEKMKSMPEPEAAPDKSEETVSLDCELDSTVQCEALKLENLAGNIEIEIMELDDEKTKQEELYQKILSLHDTHNKLDLLSKVLTFFSDWSIDGYENDAVIFSFKNSSPKKKKTLQSKHHKPAKDVVYKLHVKMNLKSLVVENAHLEPGSEAPAIDDVLKEMAFRRSMHSVEVSSEPHNDLEFLLRRIGQRISSLKKSATH